MQRTSIVPLAVLVALASAARPAAASPAFAATPHALSEIDAQLKTLAGADTSKKVDALYAWLGVPFSCPAADCKALQGAKWTVANLDADPEDERVLAVVTTSGAKCGSAHLELLLFDSTPKGWLVVARTTMRLSSVTAPTLDVRAEALHSSKLKDLVVRGDGQCTGGAREQHLRLMTFEGGALEEMFASDVQSNFTTSGSAPVTLEIDEGGGKKKLAWDAAAMGWDAYPPVADALKSTLSKDDDAVLSPKECSAPIGSSMAIDCGLSGSAKIQVLVQQGNPLGLTVSTMPASPSTVRCLRKRVAGASWPSVAGASTCTRTFAIK